VEGLEPPIRLGAGKSSGAKSLKKQKAKEPEAVQEKIIV